jgi:hypothetical protein
VYFSGSDFTVIALLDSTESAISWLARSPEQFEIEAPVLVFIPIGFKFGTNELKS